MAKILWLNPIFTGGTSLDPKINPHDVERISQTILMKNAGHEVWLHDAAAVKRNLSSYPNRVSTEDLPGFEADVAIINVGEFAYDYIGFRYHEEILENRRRAKTLDTVTNWLDSFNGHLYTAIFDPRPSFQKIFLTPRNYHPIYEHLNRALFLAPDPNFLHESLRNRAVYSDYWKLIETGRVVPYNEKEDYFCVIPMMKKQSGTRKSMISSWFDTPNCWTAGPVDVSGVKSLSDNKMVSLDWVLDVTSRSSTSLVFGEPAHTWLTPRVIQSMTTGTICSIHPSFRGSQVFSEEIRNEQTFETASQFNRDLLCEKVYKRQLNFIEELRAGAHLTGIVS